MLVKMHTYRRMQYTVARHMCDLSFMPTDNQAFTSPHIANRFEADMQ